MQPGIGDRRREAAGATIACDEEAHALSAPAGADRDVRYRQEPSVSEPNDLDAVDRLDIGDRRQDRLFERGGFSVDVEVLDAVGPTDQSVVTACLVEGVGKLVALEAGIKVNRQVSIVSRSPDRPGPSSTATVADMPRRSAPAASMVSTSSMVRMPPDALTQARPATRSAMRFTSAREAPPAGWKPVEVFTKSAPASRATSTASSMRASSSSADSMMILSTASGAAWRTAARSAVAAAMSPPSRRPRWMTTSSSLAPAPRTRRASSALAAVGEAPDGKPITEHVATPVPARRAATTGTHEGCTQAAAQW